MRVLVSFPDVAEERHGPPPGRGRKLRPRWNLGQYIFLIAAIGCLGIYGYAYLERVFYQAYESWSFDRTAAHTVAASAPKYDVREPQQSVAPTEPPLPASIIGRLSIPRLHLSAMVREGIDGKTLRLAVGHIPSTALPGQTGNVGVAGHRDTFFRGLKDLRTADEIQFSTTAGNFRYQVESLMIVEPDNVEVLTASRTNILTMVTCYPFYYVGNAPKRFIVRARQISPQT